jgi:hypothetical protein
VVVVVASSSLWMSCSPSTEATDDGQRTASPAPAPATPDPGFDRVDAPSDTSTGPTTATPEQLGPLVVEDAMVVTEAVIESVTVKPGGHLTATNVRILGSVLVSTTREELAGLELVASAVHGGLTVHGVDADGELEWDEAIPVDLEVIGSWIHHPQGEEPAHTEALAGFGWPQGARFDGTTFVQAGPFNGTATAVVNWHGHDTTFDGCYFGWGDGVAAYYTLYVDGPGNVVRRSHARQGLAGYVYPESSVMAHYPDLIDLETGLPATS